MTQETGTGTESDSKAFRLSARGDTRAAGKSMAPAGGGRGAKTHPSLVIALAALGSGVVLSFIVAYVDVEPIDPPPPIVESPNAIQTYVNLFDSYHRVAKRCLKVRDEPLNHSYVTETATFIDGQKKRLRTIDLQGVHDPTYGAMLRASRDAMLLAWHELGDALKRAGNERDSALINDAIDRLLLEAGGSLRAAAITLALSKAEFQTAVRESFVPLPDEELNDPRIQESRQRLAANKAELFEALIGQQLSLGQSEE